MVRIRTTWHRKSWHLALLVLLSLAGCQQKMADQPSYRPLEPSAFFDDGQSARTLVQGTVPRGHLRTNVAFFTGRLDGLEEPPAGPRLTLDEAPVPKPDDAVGKRGHAFDENRAFVKEIPIPVTEAVIGHGFNRYMIYCVVCHDPLGTGRGKIVERGYTKPPTLHEERLRASSVGRLFAVISEGYGSMPAYGWQIPTEDRWAIVAYLRALQLSQHFPAGDLSPAMRSAFDAAATAKGTNEKPPTAEAPR